MSLLALLQLILGTVEEIVPVFIHNPVSQKIEGVIVTTVNGVLGSLTTPKTPAPPAPPAPPAA